MKRTYIILLILGFMLSNTSCIYTKMSHLTNEDIEWVNCVNLGEIQHFESNRGGAATGVYLDKKIHNQTSRIPDNIWHLINVSDEYQANASYTLKINQGKHGAELSFLLKMPIDSTNAIISVIFANTSAEIALPKKLNSIIIGKNIYTDCIIINPENYTELPFGPYSDMQISEYCLSKRFDLIYYKMEDGEIFYKKERKLKRNLIDKSQKRSKIAISYIMISKRNLCTFSTPLYTCKK